MTVGDSPMTVDVFPLQGSANVRHNSSDSELIELAMAHGEARFTASGALSVETGAHTGRSAIDKFTVRDGVTEQAVWWDNNKPMRPEHFERLAADFRDFAKSRTLYVQDLFVGADPAHRLPTRIITEYAWHAVFMRNLLRRPQPGEIAGFTPQFTVVNLPSFRADPARHGVRSETVIACNFAQRLVLIGGTAYAGETKKAVFTYLNFVMPDEGVMPMHCSANVDPKGDAAIFFGLSGTGKTTLSADPKRTLLGDDEHGWSPNGIFNFEGGCYAKTIRLSQEAEPEIWEACHRFGTVLENVILDPTTRAPDFNDGRLTENTRAAYPLAFIANASTTGICGHPRNVVMLTADAFGVLPPIARLSPSQAMYHFLSGYTAKVAGTERGLGIEPQATFSTCFGAPFMPRHPRVYGNMLRELIARHNANCWLVNTGWTGGAYGVGRRIPIKATRALLDAALSGVLKSQPMRTDPLFKFQVPSALPGVDATTLSPRDTWADKAAYDAQARALVDMFHANFAKFEVHVDADVRAAAPAVKRAAE
jgi:phosphoenolpyruvate carboxykinase (ATP)